MQKTMSVTNLKNHLLRYVREVETTHDEIIITSRNGKPRVKIVPVLEEQKPLLNCMKDTGKIIGDIVSPLDNEWEVCQ